LKKIRDVLSGKVRLEINIAQEEAKCEECGGRAYTTLVRARWFCGEYTIERNIMLEGE
jgi:hypothetical protein